MATHQGRNRPQGDVNPRVHKVMQPESASLPRCGQSQGSPSSSLCMAEPHLVSPESPARAGQNSTEQCTLPLKPKAQLTKGDAQRATVTRNVTQVSPDSRTGLAQPRPRRCAPRPSALESTQGPSFQGQQTHHLPLLELKIPAGPRIRKVVQGTRKRRIQNEMQMNSQHQVSSASCFSCHNRCTLSVTGTV